MRFLRSLVVLTMLLAPALVAGPAATSATASPLPGDLSQRLPLAGARDCVSSGRVYVLAVNENGGVVASGCTSSFRNGKAALTSVASVTERDRDPGFVCQINGSPNVCYEGKDFNGPAQSKYWQYWQGTPGGSWSYSNWGYIPYEPKPGSVEGWCYGRTGESCPGLLNNIINIKALSTQPEPTPTRKPTRKPAPKPTQKATQKAQPPVVATTRPTQPKAATTRQAPTQPATTRSATTPPARSTSSAPSTQHTAQRSSQQPTPTAPSSARPSTSASQSPSSPATASGSHSPVSSESDSQSAQSSGNPTAVETAPVSSPPGGTNGTPWAAIATGGLIASAAAAFGITRLRGRSEE
ncbi:hypothetical protein M3G03_11470 [Aestuariimicrobium sp. p3-SID1156]|uniref:hypothetical protein n=1 Tax=Aestuariimicrobium sp. p3-SID1156 TaxID=2916038 RepID=UPI00223BC16B|nr:hypothetical protein [Aestuariimicrobium sp. p3-SID1156]MCT1460148.1 hypothetical protein [Aestuariimicrobium sp. p3-SID1156]